MVDFSERTVCGASEVVLHQPNRRNEKENIQSRGNSVDYRDLNCVMISYWKNTLGGRSRDLERLAADIGATTEADSSDYQSNPSSWLMI